VTSFHDLRLPADGAVLLEGSRPEHWETAVLNQPNVCHGLRAPIDQESVLVHRQAGAPRRNLVFTSAGDRSNVRLWLKGRRNFDVWISYYGEAPGRYSEIADFYNVRRGSKFGNLRFACDTWPELLAPYEAVLVSDDDIVISGTQTSRLFEIREEMGLWLLQAAFSPLGKISWGITRAQRDSRLRFTNFVEMTCPLFRKDKLDAFMRVFDPVLTGIGTDWWFMESLGDDIEGKVAIIDAIVCTNPSDRSKGGIRECDRLDTEAARNAAWDWVRTRYGVDRRPHRELGKISKRPPARWLSPLPHLPIDLYVRARELARVTKSRVVSRLHQRARSRSMNGTFEQKPDSR
jgi:hypothetical protein